MKKTIITILVTVALTAVLIFAIFFFVMPAVAPEFIHERMADSMPVEIHSGSMMHSAAPSGLNLDTDRLTDNGLFRASFQSELSPITINQMHSWVLHLETADGQPVEDATITIDGGMPQHGHGLPTRPQVTDYLGDGNYRVEGLRFQMGGWWEVAFDITADDQNDAITFNLVLEG